VQLGDHINAPPVQDIIDFESIQTQALLHPDKHTCSGVVCKPNPAAFELAMRQVGHSCASNIIFMDDSTRNIASAGRLGMFSVLVGQSVACEGASIAVAKLPDMPKKVPEMFDNPSLLLDGPHEARVIETAVEVATITVPA
jgi:hypothetical protein